MSERPSQTKQILDAVNALSAQMTEIRIKVASIEEKISYQPRIDAQRFDALEKAEVGCKQNYDKRLDDHDERINAIEQKPGKRWDLVWAAVISSGVGGAIAYLFKQ